MSTVFNAILAYHAQTKHHPGHNARGPGHLDWANQPRPFREYRHTRHVELPLAADALAVPFGDLFHPGRIPPRPVDLTAVALLLELSLGLAAWKELHGQRWALRCNPSSGNLHPTEGYLVTEGIPGIDPGVYHYLSRDHLLEQRCAFHSGEGGAPDPEPDPAQRAFLVGLSSIHWREAWKYGERAFRYCQHDVGHALAAIRYAAGLLGWEARLVDEVCDDTIAQLLGLDRPAEKALLDVADHEHPDLLLWVGPPDAPRDSLPRLSLAAATGTWTGVPNRLSHDHVRWHAIDTAARATAKPPTHTEAWTPPDNLPPLQIESTKPASRLIRERRSCQALDGKTALSRDAFFTLLDSVLPRPGVPPWDALPWAPHLHLVIFVHRVNDLQPGLYFLPRSPTIESQLRPACRPDLAWRPVDDAPSHLPLTLLQEGDFRETAQRASCTQEIAADGVFSLGMIAEFRETLLAHGSWWYRRLFWEAGVLGQALYLGAEAAGVRGTGIGCYFDDVIHGLLGLEDDRFQSLYHFTVGAGLDDHRLTTLPPYAHRVFHHGAP